MNGIQRNTHSSSSTGDKYSFWRTIFSVLGPFDLYGAGESDPLQRSRRDIVVQIFRLIDYPEDLEVSVAALHAISDMAESPVFSPSTPYAPHKLYTILETAGELPSVMESFVRRLEREETEQVSLLSMDGRAWQQRVHDEAGFLANFGLANLIRLQIVDFLIRNLEKSGFNLAHYLLGFGPEIANAPATSLADPEQAGQFTCLHLILELLAYGLGHPSTPIVALDHPSLGERCYELIVSLLRDPRTGRASANYLREREDFFRKQLAFFAREPVDPSDVGYTVYEMLQKSALLKGALLDLHMAVSEGAWSYARKLTTILIKGILSEKSTNEGQALGPSASSPAFEAGKSLIAVFISSVQAVLYTEYLSPLPEAVRGQVLYSASCLVQAGIRISQLILAALDHVPYDRQVMQTLQAHLVTSVVPVMAQLLVNPCATHSILEKAASLAVSIVSGFLRRVSDAPSSTPLLAGDEVPTLAVAASNALLRSDTNLQSRGFLYSLLCECVDLLSKSQERKGLLKVQHILHKDLARLLEIASTDAVVPAVEAAGWATLANSLLCVLIESAPNGSISEAISRAGFLKNLIGSLRSDDRLLAPVLLRTSDNLNPLFLWRSRFSLLQRLTMVEGSGEKLIEAGLFDVLSGLHLFSLRPPIASDSGKTFSESRWIQMMLPVLRLLNLLAHDPSHPVKHCTAVFVVVIMDPLQHAMNAYLEDLKSPHVDAKPELILLGLEIINQVSTLDQFSRKVSEKIFMRLVATLANAFDCSMPGLLPKAVTICLEHTATKMASDPKWIPISLSEDTSRSEANPTIPLSALLALIEKTVLSFSKKQEHLSGVILESLLAIFCMSLRNSPPDQRDRLLRITEQNVSRLLDDIMTAVSGRTSSESIDAIVALCANLRAVLSRTSTDRDSHSSVFSSGFLC